MTVNSVERLDRYSILQRLDMDICQVSWSNGEARYQPEIWKLLERLRIEPGEIAIGIGETLIRFDFLRKGRLKAEVRVIKAEHDRRICHCRERGNDRRVTAYAHKTMKLMKIILYLRTKFYVIYYSLK